MTFKQLKIIYTNALCCSSELAVKVSDMYSRGDKCADSEMFKLKLLNDKLNILEEYYCNRTRKVNKFFKNINLAIGCTFCCPPYPPGQDPIWDVSGDCGGFQNIAGNSIVFHTTDGGFASINVEQNAIPSSSINLAGNCFELSFDVIGDNLNPQVVPCLNLNGNQVASVSLGDKSQTYEIFSYATRKTLTFCPTSGSVLGFGCCNEAFFSISNIELKQVSQGVIDDSRFCLTEKQVDKLVHDVMESCSICDCQLK